MCGSRGAKARTNQQFMNENEGGRELGERKEGRKEGGRSAGIFGLCGAVAAVAPASSFLDAPNPNGILSRLTAAAGPSVRPSARSYFLLTKTNANLLAASSSSSSSWLGKPVTSIERTEALVSDERKFFTIPKCRIQLRA